MGGAADNLIGPNVQVKVAFPSFRGARGTNSKKTAQSKMPTAVINLIKNADWTTPGFPMPPNTLDM